MVDKKFWRNKKVFITGHTGFKGAWLCLWLYSLGAHVTGYALRPHTKPSLFELCGISKIVDSIIGDIRDYEQFHETIDAAKPDILIHMAAQSLVRESYKSPVETYATNVMGTIHCLEAVQRCPSVRAVVNVTTDKCYENKEWVWGYREHEPLGGYDPYSSSKACAELATASYRNSFFNPVDYCTHGVAIASARAGNVIGGGDWAVDRLIPDCIRALLHKEQVLIRNPLAIRPWQHVLEPLGAYLQLAQKLYEHGPEYGEAWNFGPHDNDAKPVEWIVEKLCSKWGENAAYIVDEGAHPHEAHYLKLDCSKAYAKLGWLPKWRLEQAIDKIVEWTKAYEQKQDLRTFSLQQIRDYSD